MDAQVEIALAVAVAEEVTQAVTSVETQDVTVMVQQAVAVDLTSLLDQRYHQELLLETRYPRGIWSLIQKWCRTEKWWYR